MLNFENFKNQSIPITILPQKVASKYRPLMLKEEEKDDSYYRASVVRQSSIDAFCALKSAVDPCRNIRLLMDSGKYAANFHSTDYHVVLESVRAFREMFSAIGLDAQFQNSSFLLEILSITNRFASNEIICEIGHLLANYFSHQVIAPSPEIMRFVSEVIKSTDNSNPNLLNPFLAFMTKIAQHSWAFNERALWDHISNLIGASQELDSQLISVLSASVQLCDADITNFISPIIATFESPSMIDPLFALDATAFCYFMLFREPEVFCASVFPVIMDTLRSLWNRSMDINSNLFLICGCEIPHEILTELLNESALATAIDNADEEALRLLAKLVKNGMIFDDYLNFVAKLVFEGDTRNVRIAAGFALGALIESRPDLVFPSFFSERMDEAADNFPRAISVAFDLLDDRLNCVMMRALCRLFGRFRLEGDTHPFSEMLDFQRISDKIENLLGSEDAYVCGSAELFVSTIRGVIPYSDDL
jgi:hypothetical protein